MFTIRQHEDDSEMVEMITRTKAGRITVWTVSHIDFVYNATVDEDMVLCEELPKQIRKGDEIEFELVVA